MNDRYLYRAKRIGSPNAGEWVKGTYVHTNLGREMICDGTTYIGINRPCMIDIDIYTLCACTGLKDKNGKLIWENDIMVAHLDDSFPEDTTYARVVWNNNGFCTKEQGSEDISPLDKFDQEYFEVCGNLFDNPELLEVGCGQKLDWGDEE